MYRCRGLLALLGFWPFAASAQRTIESVLQTTGNRARRLLETRFAQAGVAYPPKRIALLAIKDADRLELWARQGQRWKHVHDYRVLAASGGPGPKLREGDTWFYEKSGSTVEITFKSGRISSIR